MTSFWEVPSKLKHMLSDFEIYGMQGNRLVRPRYNILLDEITYEKKEDSRLIHGIPTCCEGASCDLYMHGCFPRFQDKHFGDRVTVVCDVIHSTIS